MSRRDCVWLGVVLGMLGAASAARGNGGGSVEITTSGAVAGGSGGALGTTELISIPEIECVSETLAIRLGANGASVQVDYVLLNHGEARTIDYAFPFAIGEVVERTKKGERSRRLGEPSAYSLTVDEARVASTTRPGAPVPAGIPVPALGEAGRLGGGQLSARYVWSYRVARIDFPAGKQRKLRVRYSAPYLAYRRSYSEDGREWSTAGQGMFSYILSTGAGWRGGIIGKLAVTVSSEGEPSELWLAGLPFRRERKGWSFEASGFRPTVEGNLLVRRPKWEEVEIRPVAAPTWGWEADSVSPASPGRMGLEVAADEKAVGERDKGRYRLTLNLWADPELAQPARVRVALGLEGLPQEVFHASFPRASEPELNEAGWRRELRFEAPRRPQSITLTYLDVVPGKGGARRLKVHSATLRADVGDYDWAVSR